MATIRVHRAELAALPVKVLVYRAELTAAPSSSATIRVYRAELASVGSASLGPNRVGVEPWSTVALTATAPGTPTSWTFTQVSGPTVTLTALGDTVSFVAPALATTNSVVISAVANYSDGSVSGAGSVDVEVLYATEYVNTSTGWLPCRIQTFDPVP